MPMEVRLAGSHRDAPADPSHRPAGQCPPATPVQARSPDLLASHANTGESPAPYRTPSGCSTRTITSAALAGLSAGDQGDQVRVLLARSTGDWLDQRSSFRSTPNPGASAC